MQHITAKRIKNYETHCTSSRAIASKKKWNILISYFSDCSLNDGSEIYCNKYMESYNFQFMSWFLFFRAFGINIEHTWIHLFFPRKLLSMLQKIQESSIFNLQANMNINVIIILALFCSGCGGNEWMINYFFLTENERARKNYTGPREGSLRATENINYKARSHLHLNEKPRTGGEGGGRDEWGL